MSLRIESELLAWADPTAPAPLIVEKYYLQREQAFPKGWADSEPGALKSYWCDALIDINLGGGITGKKRILKALDAIRISEPETTWRAIKRTCTVEAEIVG